MGARRTMGAVDSIWLSMDRPDNLMVIDSIMLLDGPADWERLEAVVSRRLVERYPVFSQRAVDSANPVGMPHWEDDDDFADELFDILQDVEEHDLRDRLEDIDENDVDDLIDLIDEDEDCASVLFSS